MAQKLLNDMGPADTTIKSWRYADLDTALDHLMSEVDAAEKQGKSGVFKQAMSEVKINLAQCQASAHRDLDDMADAEEQKHLGLS